MVILLITETIFQMQYYSQGSFCVSKDQILMNQQKLKNMTTDSDKLNDFCSDNYFAKQSIINIVKDRKMNYYLEKMSYHNYISYVLLFMAQCFMRYVIQKSDQIIDDKLLSGADYTILIQNLPNQLDKEYCVKKEIIEFINQILIKQLSSEE